MAVAAAGPAAGAGAGGAGLDVGRWAPATERLGDRDAERRTAMSDKPSYLGLLNTIAVAESRAHCYLSAWAEVTTDPDVKAILEKVALREGEHGMAFAKRIKERGYTVREKAAGE